jgi:hypothetical protein
MAVMVDSDFRWLAAAVMAAVVEMEEEGHRMVKPSC